MKLRLAILSDLHCHPDRSGNNDTYLLSDMLRIPSDLHPVESLRSIIKDENLNVDFTLSLGDITDRMSQQGFISGWNYTQEINEELKGKEVLATIGNHDVDSRGDNSSYCLEIAQGIKKNFPLKDIGICNTFWSQGGVFFEDEVCRILVINSAHFHYSKVNSGKGRVDDRFIEYVENYLAEHTDNKICVAFAHHHPDTHPNTSYEHDDKMVNGDKLMEILGKYSFDLFIHGHQHDPLLRYSSGDPTSRIPILSAGSFSATSNQSFTGQRNSFHILELEKNGTGIALGTIKTWTFMPRSGWNDKLDLNGFPPYTGFGFKGSITELADKILEEMGDSPMKNWDDILANLPDINHLIPSEINDLGLALIERKLILPPAIIDTPRLICNTTKL